MPYVTYKGPWYSNRNPDVKEPDFIRGDRREVSQAWLDQHRRRLGEKYLIEGDEPAHRDEGNDGIPDASWRRNEIVNWLNAYGVDLAGGYKTKSSLLSLVDVVLSPEVEEELEISTEEEVVEEEVEAESEVTEEEVESEIEE